MILFIYQIPADLSKESLVSELRKLTTFIRERRLKKKINCEQSGRALYSTKVIIQMNN